MQSSLKGFFTAKPKEPKEPKESKEKKEDVTPSNVPAAAATASSAPTKKQTPLSTKQTPLFAKQPAAAVSSTSKPTGKRGAPVEVPSDSAPSNKKQTPTRDHSDVPMADIHTTPAARRPAPPSSCAAADSSTGKHVAAALSQASTAPKRPSPSILASPPPAPSSAGSATPAAAGDSRQLSHSFIKEKRDAKGRKLGDAGYDPTTLKIVRPSKGFTPAMEQYWEIKSSHVDMLLFFKMGKFYEMFEEVKNNKSQRRARTHKGPRVLQTHAPSHRAQSRTPQLTPEFFFSHARTRPLSPTCSLLTCSHLTCSHSTRSHSTRSQPIFAHM